MENSERRPVPFGRRLRVYAHDIRVSATGDSVDEAALQLSEIRRRVWTFVEDCFLWWLFFQFTTRQIKSMIQDLHNDY